MVPRKDIAFYPLLVVILEMQRSFVAFRKLALIFWSVFVLNKLERWLGVRPIIVLYVTVAVSLLIMSVTVSQLRFLIKRVPDVS